MDDHEHYLGDGVAAAFDGYQLWLRLKDGRPWEIALEPAVWEALRLYIQNLPERMKLDKEQTARFETMFPINNLTPEEIFDRAMAKAREEP